MTILISNMPPNSAFEVFGLLTALALLVLKIILLAAPNHKFARTLSQLLTMGILPLMVVIVVKVVLAFVRSN